MPPCTSFDDFDDVPDAKSPLSTSAVRRPAAGGVERDARPGDAAADDEDVELLGGQAAQRVGTVERHGARLPGSSSQLLGRPSHQLCAMSGNTAVKRTLMCRMAESVRGPAEEHHVVVELVGVHRRDTS